MNQVELIIMCLEKAWAHGGALSKRTNQAGELVGHGEQGSGGVSGKRSRSTGTKALGKVTSRQEGCADQGKG